MTGKDGAPLVSVGFLAAGSDYEIRCEVVGTSGALTRAEPVRLVTDRADAEVTSYAPDWRPRFAEAHRMELRAWVDGVNGGGRGVAVPDLGRQGD